MMITTLFSRIFRQYREPVDLPGAILPGAVIKKHPLLYKLPELIGFDLRQLTADRLRPMDICPLKKLDGTEYAGAAKVHEHFYVTAESGEGINGRPYWVVDVFADKVNTEFMQELCAALWRVYGTPFISYGAGKYTSYDLEEAESQPLASLKYWQNLKLENYWLQHCTLWLRTYEYGRVANLHFHIFDV